VGPQPEQYLHVTLSYAGILCSSTDHCMHVVYMACSPTYTGASGKWKMCQWVPSPSSTSTPQAEVCRTAPRLSCALVMEQAQGFSSGVQAAAGTFLLASNPSRFVYWTMVHSMYWASLHITGVRPGRRLLLWHSP
jgi:hypothetical protein